MSKGTTDLSGKFTQTGTGASQRFVEEKLSEIVSVKDFLAAGDGITDDSTAFSQAIAASINGGSILIPPSATGYLLSTGITLPSNKTIRLIGNGVKITYTGTGTLFSIANNSNASTAPQHIIEGFDLVSNTNGQGTAVQITDSMNQTVRDLRIKGFDKGVELATSSGSLATKQTCLENIAIWDCNYGVAFTKSTGSGSFTSTLLRKVKVYSMAGASSATPYGYYISTGSNIQRSTMVEAGVIVDKASGTGLYCNGDMTDIFGNIGIDSQAGVTISNCANNGSGLIRVTTSAVHNIAQGNLVYIAGVTGTTEANGFWTATYVNTTTIDLQGSTFTNTYVSGGQVSVPNNVGLKVDTNATGTALNLQCNITGYIATYSSIVPSSDIFGLKLSGNMLIRKASTSTTLRKVYNSDTITMVLKETITSSNNYRFDTPYATPPEFYDSVSSSYIPVRQVTVGTGKSTVTSGTTIDAKGKNTILLNHSSTPVTVTSITNGVDGQKLTLIWNKASITLQHTDTANGVLLSGSVNFTTGIQYSRMHLEFITDRWYELSRVQP